MRLRNIPLLCLLTLPAHAVIIRGRVATPLGIPLPGAHIQLIQGPSSVADTISGIDGEYEIRSNLAGRFLLLTSASITAAQPSIQIGSPFYAGRTDLLTLDIALAPASLTPQTSTLPTLRETPIPQLSAYILQVAPGQLLTQATTLPELRPAPGVFVVQSGPIVAPAFLYLRGAPPSAIKTLIDGVSAEDLGGRFNLGTVSSSGFAASTAAPAIELTSGSSPLHFLDAEAGVLSLQTAVAADLHPTLTYTGDAGNLASLRNEAVVSVIHTRTDLLASFARFDTAANDAPAAPAHVATYAANFGYFISANASLRLTFRDEFSASNLPSAFNFFQLSPSGRQADQNLYSTGTLDTRTAGNWHNLLRVGVARKRAETSVFSTPSVGLPVTIRGANGYTASGAATFLPLPPREDLVTNRDEYTFQSDRPLTHFVTALVTIRYQDERAADLIPALAERSERRHLSVAASFQGAVRERFFYAASGFVDHSALLGSTGSPAVGLTYVPVRAGRRRFRGTSLHLSAATGLREPSLLEQFLIARPTTPRSRSFDLSVDQNLLTQKLTVRAAYFHSQFSHEPELLALDPVVLSQTLAFRTQGLESTLRFQPGPRLLLQGGYTFLASLVEQSATVPSFNPQFRGIAIGALSALRGARPFERPPQTGFFALEYTGRVLSATMKAAFASRSDDSTGLVLNPTLLLPNRNLSPGYTSLDANVTYAATRHITAFTQLTNLLNSHSIAPLGFVSTPFMIRAGLRIRLGRE